MNEKKLEILYDHYKDTFENQKIYLNKRNTYTLICLSLIAAFSFQIASPAEVVTISDQLIKKSIGNVKVNFNYINNILTFGLLWVVVMYFQISLLIERQYSYIQNIEEKLTNELKSFSISREGKTYLENYPWLLFIVHRIYTIVFPISLIAVAIIKWITEKKSIDAPWKDGHFWFDTIFLTGIVLIALLYLSNRHFNDFRNKIT